MPFIHLTTFIGAPRQIVFDLSRSVDLHCHSMSRYGETIVAGTKNGLMQLGDTVTWTARHLFRQRTLQVKVTQLAAPDYFADEQVQGDFVLMKHEHYFKAVENGTLMIDQFRFETPHGTWGRLLNQLYLEKYMTRLLEERNGVIRSMAEGNQWQQFLKG